MRILILLFRQFYIVVANDCECEVEPWSNWYRLDATCGSAMERRERVCSTCDGWTFCMKCIDEDNRIKYEYKPVDLPSCRKYFFRFKINSTYWLAETFIWEKDGDKIHFTECPAGFNCAKPDAISQCPDGTFSDASATICLTCTPGNFCQNGITEKCPPEPLQTMKVSLNVWNVQLEWIVLILLSQKFVHLANIQLSQKPLV